MSIFKSKISIFKKKKNLGAKKYLGAKSVFLRKIKNLGAKLVFFRAKIIMFQYLLARKTELVTPNSRVYLKAVMPLKRGTQKFLL